MVVGETELERELGVHHETNRPAERSHDGHEGRVGWRGEGRSVGERAAARDELLHRGGELAIEERLEGRLRRRRVLLEPTGVERFDCLFGVPPFGLERFPLPRLFDAQMVDGPAAVELAFGIEALADDAEVRRANTALVERLGLARTSTAMPTAGVTAANE